MLSNIRCEKYDMDNKQKYLMEKFVEDDESICREERQYAVFLYNILSKYKKPGLRNTEDIKKVFECCKIPENAEIEKVFYEASFMRDFFKISEDGEDCDFNDRLLKYAAEDVDVKYIGIKHNLGHKELKYKELKSSDKGLKNKNSPDFRWLKFKIRCMMNAKPDIAVIYIENGIRMLLFIECKFESRTAIYKAIYKDKETSEKLELEQREVQWMIADFLCNHYLEKNYMKVSGEMKDGQSCLVQFVRSKEESGRAQEKILISNLINLNEDIFS